jgi:excisionase family DNA binding protein
MTQAETTQILFVSVPEAAKRLGIGKTLLYEQIQAGKFPHRRIGGRIVVSIKVLERLAEPDQSYPT